jgi:hypothetical protein
MPYRDRKRTRDERLGESFRLNDQYEALMAMPVERRDAILKSSPVMRISLGHYRAARSAALTLEQERTS